VESKNSSHPYLIYLLSIFLLASFLLCYHNTFSWLHYKYSLKDSYYSHGYLIPFISLYLIYIIREKIKTIELSSSFLGLGIIILALVIHVFAVMSDINFISGFSIFFFIIGCILYLFGKKVARELAFPLGFLLFLFPIPDNYINIIALPSKSLATDIGLMVIDWLDIPYFREGFIINLTDTSLFVGTPCNGMKSLISFIALGVLAIYIIKLGLIRNFIIIACIYPLSIFINGCRIALLVYIADTYGIEKASPESFIHDLSGLIVFFIGFIILILFINLLEWKRNR